MRVSLSSHPHTERKREREIEIEGEQGPNNLVASHLPWRLHHCALWIPVPSEEFQLYFWTQFALPKYFSIQLLFTCRRLRSLFSISLPHSLSSFAAFLDLFPAWQPAGSTNVAHIIHTTFSRHFAGHCWGRGRGMR